MALGTSLAVHSLRLSTSNAGGTGSIPGRGTKFPRAMQWGQKINKKKKKKKDIVALFLVQGHIWRPGRKAEYVQSSYFNY